MKYKFKCFLFVTESNLIILNLKVELDYCMGLVVESNLTAFSLVFWVCHHIKIIKNINLKLKKKLKYF